MLVRPTAANGVIVEDLDDDVCLYRADIDEVLVLNQAAGDIWRLSDGELTVDEIASRLSVSYDLPHTDLSNNVRSVVDDLETRGYLVEYSSSATP